MDNDLEDHISSTRATNLAAQTSIIQTAKTTPTSNVTRSPPQPEHIVPLPTPQSEHTIRGKEKSVTRVDHVSTSTSNSNSMWLIGMKANQVRIGIAATPNS